MKRRTWARAGLCLLLLAGLGFVATGVEVCKTVAYVCENTGSRFGYQLWPGGYKTALWERQSPLEVYLAASLKRPVTHRWSRCAYMGTTILGSHISFADGPVGGMVTVRDDDLRAWIASHSRREILALYDSLRMASLEDTRRSYGATLADPIEPRSRSWRG